MSGAARDRLSGALTVLAALALVVGLAAAYVRRVAVDPDQFADRAALALRAPAVRSLVAEQVTDDLVLRHADALTAARPLIETVVSSAIGGRAFGDLFRAGVRDLHRAVLARDANTVTLTVADAGTLVASALDVLRPSLATRLRLDDRAQLLRARIGEVGAGALRLTDRVRVLAWLGVALALLAAAGALALAGDRRRTLTGLGVAVAVTGVLCAVAWGVGRTLVLHAVPTGADRAAAGAVWNAFLAPLRTGALLLAGLGAVLAAATASLRAPGPIGPTVLGIGRRVVAGPRRAPARAVWALGVIGLGVACVLDPGALLTAAVDLVGTLLVYAGLSTLLRLIVPAPDPSGSPRTSAGSRLPGLRAGLAVLAVAGLASVATGVWLTSGPLSAPGPSPAPCDGSRSLCARPLTDVALAATHNAMSVPLPGWYSAEQEAPIPRQLQDGIRGLLIDTHYADRLSNGRLRTDVQGTPAAAGLDELSAQARRAAERLRSRAGYTGTGPRGIYLCHGFCELGATPLATVLDQIHDFLVADPQQVLVVINEDYVSPRGFVDAIRRAGLARLAFTPPARGAWPTLQQMIDGDHRILFLAEHRAGAASWYRPAYRALTEETPYHFTRSGQLTSDAQRARSCRPNRGPASGAPLFLVNNWVSTDPVPLPTNAARVNARGPLLRRLRACERIRHHLPNLVAVNFYRQGDLLGAVDALNGVTSRP